MKFKGSIKDILAMTDEDINRMSADELKAVTKRLVDASNKRIKRLEQARSTYTRGRLATQSRAYQGLVDRKTGEVRRFSVSDKAIGATGAVDRKGKLHQEFARAKRFLEAKTSTITGTMELAESLSKELKFATNKAETAFWELYGQIAKNNKDLIGGANTEGYAITSNEFQRVLYDRVFQGKSPTKRNIRKPKSIIKDMTDYLNKLYENQQKAQKKQKKDESNSIRFKFEKIKIF